MQSNELSYLAGIFDGEGTINISARTGEQRPQPRYFLRVCVDMNHWPTVDTFHAAFGGSISTGRTRANARTWTLRNAEGIRFFLKHIGPFLRVKREQAEVAIAFLDAHSFSGKRWSRQPITANIQSSRKAFYEQMGELNQSHWWKRRQNKQLPAA